MTFVFDPTPDQPTEIKLTIGDAEVTLLAGPLTWEQRIMDDAQLSFLISNRVNGAQFTGEYSHRAASRLNAVQGWRGVNDLHNNPVPFSRERLIQLLAKYPSALADVNVGLARLYDIPEPVAPATSEPTPAS